MEREISNYVGSKAAILNLPTLEEQLKQSSSLGRIPAKTS